jgi:hypothetical protein
MDLEIHYNQCCEGKIQNVKYTILQLDQWNFVCGSWTVIKIEEKTYMYDWTVVRKLYNEICVNWKWGIKYSCKFYNSYKETSIVEIIKITRLPICPHISLCWAQKYLLQKMGYALTLTYHCSSGHELALDINEHLQECNGRCSVQHTYIKPFNLPTLFI